MKSDNDGDTIPRVIAFVAMIIIGWSVYDKHFKRDDTSAQQPAQNEDQYDIHEYRTQQENQEECLQIVSDYLKNYGYNVTYIYTTNPEANNWKYNVRGTITNFDGTTSQFGIMYDHATKTITRCDIE